MALKAASIPLSIIATQGSADAFVQASTPTGLSGNQAYRLKSIIVRIGAGSTIMAIATDFEWVFQLTRRSKSAIGTLDDFDIIWQWAIAVTVTTSGSAVIPVTQQWDPPEECAIVEETIYASFDSTGVGTALSANVRLDLELDTMSDVNRLNLISRSLA